MEQPSKNEGGGGMIIVLIVLILLCGGASFYFLYYRYTNAWTIVNNVNVDSSLITPGSTNVSLYTAQKTAYSNNNPGFFVTANGTSNYDVYYYPSGSSPQTPLTSSSSTSSFYLRKGKSALPPSGGGVSTVTSGGGVSTVTSGGGVSTVTSGGGVSTVTSGGGPSSPSQITPSGTTQIRSSLMVVPAWWDDNTTSYYRDKLRLLCPSSTMLENYTNDEIYSTLLSGQCNRISTPPSNNPPTIPSNLLLPIEKWNPDSRNYYIVEANKSCPSISIPTLQSYNNATVSRYCSGSCGPSPSQITPSGTTQMRSSLMLHVAWWDDNIRQYYIEQLLILCPSNSSDFLNSCTNVELYNMILSGQCNGITITPSTPPTLPSNLLLPIEKWNPDSRNYYIVEANKSCPSISIPTLQSYSNATVSGYCSGSCG
jgi:hypothetical protein